MDGDIRIQFFLPEGESTTMSTRFLEGQQVVKSVFRIEKVVIKITYLISSKWSIRKVEPGFAEEDEGWIL